MLPDLTIEFFNRIGCKRSHTRKCGVAFKPEPAIKRLKDQAPVGNMCQLLGPFFGRERGDEFE